MTATPDEARTTMITAIVAHDLFVDNDVYLLSRAQHPRLAALGGVVWLERQPPRSAHLNTLEVAVPLVQRVLPDHRLWLLAALTELQPNSAVARYWRRRLWKALEARGMDVPAGPRVGEISKEDDGVLRWFGAVECGAEDLSKAMKIIEEERSSVLIAVPNNARGDVEKLVATGWERSWTSAPRDILEWLEPLEGVAFWPVGWFDDVESGVVAFCSPRIVALLEGTGELLHS